MKVTLEHGIDEETFTKLDAIHTKAIYKGDFGDSLNALSPEELQLIMAMNEKFLFENISEWSPGIFGRLITGIRKKINKINGKKYNPVPEHIRILQKLRMEILSAFGRLKPDEPEAENSETYMDKFLIYLKYLDEKIKGPNATELKVKSYVRVSLEQEKPGEKNGGKIVISYRLSFEENLTFIQEHMNEAVIQNNLKETEARMQMERDREMNKY